MDVFFERHPGLSLRLVRGNHDRHVGTLPGAWPIEVVGDYQLGPIALSHHPGILPEGAELLLCGHLHPAIRLAAAKEQIGKLPCFWLSGGRLVLPAVGEFTGTHVIRPAPGDRVWLLVDGQVVEYRRPTRRRGRRLV